MGLPPFRSFPAQKKEMGMLIYKILTEWTAGGVYTDGNCNMNKFYDETTEKVPRATGSLQKSIC